MKKNNDDLSTFEAAWAAQESTVPVTVSSKVTAEITATISGGKVRLSWAQGALKPVEVCTGVTAAKRAGERIGQRPRFARIQVAVVGGKIAVRLARRHDSGKVDDGVYAFPKPSLNASGRFTATAAVEGAKDTPNKAYKVEKAGEGFVILA